MTYKLKSLDITTTHWPNNVMLVRDGATNKAGKAELEAQVNSGDYLPLLATRLDQISQSLQKKNHTDYVILENTIRDLLYLHQRYKLAKK